MPDAVRDRWAEWVLDRRFGGDRTQYERAMEHVARFRERVLDNARLESGETVLDVGAGDGLIAFGALERLGPEGSVIFSDVSDDLLQHARAIAEELGVASRCSFVPASADDLASIEDSSVDVVTTRSVLIYLDREGKWRAFEEFHRVLRPGGGRLSIFEPINRFGHPEPQGWFFGYDLSEVAGLVAKVLATVSATAGTLLDFDERDLLEWAAGAGFDPIRLEYEAELAPGSWMAGGWDVVLRSSPNPLAPTLGEALEQALTEDERAAFEQRLRPLVEANRGRRRMAGAYLSGTRP